MKCVIIDDSDLARSELRYLLQPFDYVQIVGEADSASSALEEIEKAMPDLIFLDIQMPGKDGFALLEELDSVPEVIFTTAYDEYAFKAFEFKALDYLKKPIREDRLKFALETVIKRTDLVKAKRQKNESVYLNERVFVKEGEKCWFVKLSEIKYFEIYGNYTRVHFEDHKPLIPRSLNFMESRLDPNVFFRINRQQIINMSYIKKVEPWYGGAIKILLAGDINLTISKRQSIRFRERLSF